MKDISGVGWQVLFGSCLDRLPELADNSIDAVVTDPPYELGFMGKKWDSSGIAFDSAVWRECLRVLKPGGHLLAFGGSRTWHRIAVAIEDAGFEVRDSIAWLYGSGFPKSLDVSKAIDKAAGAEREVIGKKITGNARTEEGGAGGQITVDETAPSTPEAQKWQGWGTALKPAFEPVVVGRKPLMGTVAANVLEWGVGGLNIDGSRIPVDPKDPVNKEGGRWPANVMLDEYTAGLLDKQSGVLKSGAHNGNRSNVGADPDKEWVFKGGWKATNRIIPSNEGGASRFFYVAKASKRDRNEGLDGLETRRASAMGYERGLGDAGEGMFKDRNPQKQNFHPTVKPTDLMRQLIRLVTPPGGVVLDPFTGSGSTGKAAILEGFEFVGVELTEDYLPIIEGRLSHAVDTVSERGKADDEKLF